MTCLTTWSSERLRSALQARPRHIVDPADMPTHRPAAVLVPLVVRDGAPALVFTLRAASLRVMGGQISFPGGRPEATDRDAAATAIREADEEIGVEPGIVEVLGALDDVPTPSGFIITPVVATLAPPPAAYRPNPAEVAEVFEVPLARFLEPGVLVDNGDQERWGRLYRICEYHVDGRKIWGATARLTWMLLQTLA